MVLGTLLASTITFSIAPLQTVTLLLSGGQTLDAGPIIWAAGARIIASGGKVSTLGDNVLCQAADEATVYF